MAKRTNSLNLFKKHVPFYVTIIIVLFSIVLTSAFIKIESKQTTQGNPASSFANNINSDGTTDNIQLIRENENKLIRPILIASATNESDKLLPLKNSLTDLVNKMTQDGNVTETSVYVSRLNEGDWINIDPDKTFRPRSLVKVPILITYLKMAEKDPSVMNRKFYYNNPDTTVPVQSFVHKIIQAHKIYSTKELLQEMIINSDNYATILLYEHVDSLALKELFNALQIHFSGFGQMSYEINSSDYSKFFQVLYNGTYLTQEDSQFALSLLTKTDFKIGMCKELPPSVTIAHKFGENNTNDSKQLHESGIIYIDKNPYLLTVMTRGNDLAKLPDAISNISKVVFDFMQNNQKL